MAKLSVDIKLRPARLEDYKDLREIRTSPNVMWGTMGYPSQTEEATKKWLEDTVLDDNHHLIVAESRSKVVGSISLRVGKLREAHAGKLGMMVHPDFQGKGVGNALMGAILDLSDNFLNLKRVSLSVFPDNRRAINLYKKFGFKEEGRRRKVAIRDGEFIDDLIMARLRD